MLLRVEKYIRDKICHAIHQYAKKDYDKNKEPLYLKYWDVKNLYGWALSQKLPLGGFKWVEETSQFNKSLIKSYNEDSDTGYFLEVDVQYANELHEIHNDLPFLPKREKIEKVFQNHFYIHLFF